jgi:hypothetical protein
MTPSYAGREKGGWAKAPPVNAGPNGSARLRRWRWIAAGASVLKCCSDTWGLLIVHASEWSISHMARRGVSVVTAIPVLNLQRPRETMPPFLLHFSIDLHFC